MTLLILGLLACAEVPLKATATVDGPTVTVWASRPGFAVEVTDGAGVPLARGTAAADTTTLALPPGTAGSVRVVVREGGDMRELGLDVGDPATAVEIAVPLGATFHVVKPGETLHVELIEGTNAWGSLRAAGAVTSFALTSLSMGVAIPGGTVTVVVDPIPLDRARRELVVSDVVFPATEGGAADFVRPKGRVTLPSPWWRDVMDLSPLGVTARDEFAAWGWTAVRLENTGVSPMDVVVRARILDVEGAPDPAFRPRVRAADDGTGNTSVLLRVPAGASATATIPLFVSENLLGSGPWRRVVDVLPIGMDTPLLTRTDPLYLSRSSSWLAGGLALTLGTALGGMVLVLTRVRRWLAEFDTASLVTIALFAALIFVAGTVGQLLGLGAAAAAGPFATMVIGLVDDALQATLIGTLVTVLPRPGTATLTVLVAWLLRGIATGTLSPMDVTFVACRIATLEGGLYLFGLTRGGAWREGSRRSRVLRLGLGLAVGSLAGTAASLVLHAALFRLYFAPWYVAMVLAGPGFLYVLAAAGVADRVATQLRRVED